MAKLSKIGVGPAHTHERDSSLRSYSDELPRVTQHLARQGALALVVVDASGLEAIELDYGPDHLRRAAEAVGALIHQVCAECVGDGFVVVMEPGVDEFIVFLFRPRDSHSFYNEDLPALSSGLSERLSQQAARICYPYIRGEAYFPVGHSFAFHNPIQRPAKLVLRAREQARAEAALRDKLHQRRHVERFHHLVLAENVTSVYEPIVHMKSDEVMGYESLIRGPAGSEFESPAALFAMAEKSDLLFELDCLCRRTGLQGAGGIEAGQKLFLNCLPSAIHDPDLQEDQLHRSLGLLGLQPSDVVFEISEKETIHNFALFREVRDRYKTLGFGVALDDVGAGYSGLETVMELAPDFIKLDLSIVRNIDSDTHRRELVQAMHNVSEKIGAQVIAEGVSSKAERRTLGELGIPFAQGHLIGRASPEIRPPKAFGEED